jgi:hypothetical protein
MLKDSVALVDAESVTFTVKVLVPVLVGKPEIAPELLLRERPAGNDPLLMAQV